MSSRWARGACGAGAEPPRLQGSDRRAFQAPGGGGHPRPLSRSGHQQAARWSTGELRRERPARAGPREVLALALELCARMSGISMWWCLHCPNHAFILKFFVSESSFYIFLYFSAFSRDSFWFFIVSGVLMFQVILLNSYSKNLALCLLCRHKVHICWMFLSRILINFPDWFKYLKGRGQVIYVPIYIPQKTGNNRGLINPY